MKKIKLSIIFNETFKLFIIFLICQIWCRKLIKHKTYSTIAAIAITAIAYFCLNLILKKHSSKNALKAAELEKIKQCTTEFILCPQTQTINFFYNLASTRHQAEKKRDHIKILHKSGNVLLYPIFKFASITPDNIIAIYNKTKNQNAKRIIICANIISPEAYGLCRNLNKNFCLLDSNETYLKLFKEYNYFPEIKQQSKKLNNVSYKSILAKSLNRSRTKGYFVSSLCLLFSSFFVKYNIYYVVASTLLLVLCLVSFFNIKYNKTPTEEIL